MTTIGIAALNREKAGAVCSGYEPALMPSTVSQASHREAELRDDVAFASSTVLPTVRPLRFGLRKTMRFLSLVKARSTMCYFYLSHCM